MNWKQPIPVVIEEFGGNKFRQTIFQLLLLRCANKPQDVPVNDAYIHIERGQCVVGRFELAALLGLKRQNSLKVWREIKKIEKMNKLLKYQKSRDCAVVTIYNYDEWVRFETTNETSVKHQRNNHETPMNTNKSAKNENTQFFPKPQDKIIGVGEYDAMMDLAEKLSNKHHAMRERGYK